MQSENETLGRFGHHPEPACDFCVEVEILEGMAYDVEVGVIDARTVADRVFRAMTFNVGGDEIAIAAKATLRRIEKGLANLAQRKEVMPHGPEVHPRHDTTPPQARKPGVTDEDDIVYRLNDYNWKTFGAPGSPTIFAEAAIEIRRLRTREAEQAARIAALETGLRPFARLGAIFPSRAEGCFDTLIYEPAGDPSRVIAGDDLREAARLLPQEGK